MAAQAELDEEAARAEAADRELNEREREGLAGGASPEGRPDDEAQGPGAVRSISMLQKCRDVSAFKKIRRISEGTYGVVYQCAHALVLHHAPAVILDPLLAQLLHNCHQVLVSLWSGQEFLSREFPLAPGVAPAAVLL